MTLSGRDWSLNARTVMMAETKWFREAFPPHPILSGESFATLGEERGEGRLSKG